MQTHASAVVLLSRRGHRFATSARKGTEMKPSTLYAIALGIVSGVAIAYIYKCKRLKRQNDEQADEIERLHKFIYKEVLI